VTICVCGWYYTPSFYEALKMSGYRSTIIAHRPGDTRNLPVIPAPNVGLEWGAYTRFLAYYDLPYVDPTPSGMLPPVLFLHDDTEVVGPETFEDIAASCQDHDVAFLFHDADEARQNGGAHGRAVYLSERMLRLFRPMGFWYDEGNGGDTTSARAQAGIQHFLKDLSLLRDRPSGRDLRIGIVLVPGLDCGYRGRIGAEALQYRMTHFRQEGEAWQD